RDARRRATPSAPARSAFARRRRSRPRASGERALAGQGPADDELLYLARAFVQSRDPRVSQVLADGIVVHVTVATVHLHGGVRGTDGSLAREVLRVGRLERVRLARVCEGGRAPDE